MCAVPAVKTRHIYGKVKAERAFYILFSTILYLCCAGAAASNIQAHSLTHGLRIEHALY